MYQMMIVIVMSFSQKQDDNNDKRPQEDMGDFRLTMPTLILFTKLILKAEIKIN